MGLPFTKKITEADLLDKFKLPHIDHLETYRAHMILQASTDAMLYQVFPLTLKGATKRWFSSLQPQSIGTFTKLGKNFISHFIGNRRQHKPMPYLLTIKQEHDESVKSYMARFNHEKLTVNDPDERIVHPALMGGIWRYSPFMSDITHDPPWDLDELMARVKKFINDEETVKVFAK
jgi:hypothetical protein